MHRPGNHVAVGDAGFERRQPRRLDGEVVSKECDHVAAGDFEAGVTGDVEVAVGDFDQHVHVVALSHHPGRAVGGGTVDDDDFRVGGVLGQRVEAGGEPVPTVERREHNREVHTRQLRWTYLNVNREPC